MRSLSAIEKWSYAVGNIPYAVKDAAFGSFVVFYYTQVLGLSGTLAGLAMLIALSWDAVSDPIVGSWSDGVKTRWGRRHPLILVGGVLTSLMFLLLFRPPEGLSELQMFLWLVAVSIVLRTFLTIYFIPYQAMGAEMSQDYDERTVIVKARVTVAWLGGMAMPAIGYALIFQSVDGVDGRLVAENYWYYGVLTTAVALIATVICAWGTRGTIAHLPQAAPHRTKFSLTLPFKDFREALRNHNFRQTIGSKLAFGVCAGAYATMGAYVAAYFWEFSTDQLAGLVVPTLFGTLTAFALLNRFGQRYDKNVIFSTSMLLFAINIVWFVGARMLDLLPPNGHPILYPLQLLQVYISVMMIVCFQVMGASLLADILDEHELNTGKRSEGVFFAASAFVYKATTGLGTFVAGIAVDVSGLEPGMAPGEVPAQVLTSLGWFSGPAVAGAALFGWYFARRIKINRQRLSEIRQQLATEQ